MGTEIISDSQSSNHSAKKARMYSMDLSLLKCIEAGMDDREKEEADVIIVKRIVSLLEKLLKDNYSNVSEFKLHPFVNLLSCTCKLLEC